MGQAAPLATDLKPRRVDEPGETSSFAKLQELTRHGYVPDTQPVGDRDGILLRHPSAPNLILWANGTVDLPTGQALKMPSAPAPKLRNKRRWGRALLIFTLLAVYTFFSFLVLVAINE